MRGSQDRGGPRPKHVHPLPYVRFTHIEFNAQVTREILSASLLSLVYCQGAQKRRDENKTTGSSFAPLEQPLTSRSYSRPALPAPRRREPAWDVTSSR